MSKEKDLKLVADEAPKPVASKKKLIIMIVAIVVVLIISIGVTVFIMLPDGNVSDEGSETKETVEKILLPANYVKLKPEFIINFQVGGRQRFLQIYMEVMTRDETVVSAVERHSPLIRNNVITFIGDQKFSDLRTPTGKEKLREDLKLLINNVLEKEMGIGVIEEVLFTNFVMQ